MAAAVGVALLATVLAARLPDSGVEGAAFVTAIITLSHSLGLEVIAEGVETAEQLAFLKSQSCDAMQGYYFSKAVSPESLLQLLQEGRTLG